MSNIIGKVRDLDGKFYATSENGDKRELIDGDVIYENEIVFGDKDNRPYESVIITLVNNEDLVILGIDIQDFSTIDMSPEKENTTDNEEEAIATLLAKTDEINPDDIETAAGEEAGPRSTEGEEAAFAVANGALADIVASILDRSVKISTFDDGIDENEEARRFDTGVVDVNPIDNDININSSSDGIINSNESTKVDISGTSEANSTVSIVLADENGNIISVEVISDATGSWSSSVDISDLDDGNIVVVGSVVDSSGNVATLDPTSIEKDTTVVNEDGTTLSADLSDDTNSGSLDDNITNDNTPDITGTTEAGASVVITNAAGDVVGTGTADENGDYTITVTELPEGENTLHVEVTDAAGNTASTDVVVEVDTIFGESADGSDEGITADIIDSSDTGISNTDDVTSDNTPTIEGTTAAGAIVVITDANGDVVGTATADENGDYSITTSELDDGTQDLVVSATDTDSNTTSTTQTITVDTTVNAPIITNIIDNYGDHSSVILFGTGEAGSIVTVYSKEGSTTGGNNTNTNGYAEIDTSSNPIVVDENGNWTLDISSLDSTPVNDNEFLKAVQTDISGNISSESNTVHYWHGTWSNVSTEVEDDFIMMGLEDDTILINDDDSNDSIVIDGGKGLDTAEFTGNYEEYILNTTNGVVYIEEPSQSDINELRNIETINFADGSYDVSTGNFTYITDFNDNKSFDEITPGDDGVDTTLLIEGDSEINLNAIDEDNIDIIDLGTGTQDVTLTLSDVLNITDDDNTLKIDTLPGDSDIVQIDTNEWTLSNSQSSNDYNVYTGLDDMDLVTLQISTQITVDES
jgi:hypothetical protein